LTWIGGKTNGGQLFHLFEFAESILTAKGKFSRHESFLKIQHKVPGRKDSCDNGKGGPTPQPDLPF